MRPTARCCAGRNAPFTSASPKLSRVNSRRSPSASRNFWRVTAPRPGRSRRPRTGQRSLARSALVEAVEQLSRALGQIADLPATPARRREQIKLQVELIVPLFHVKGYAAPETKAAVERAHLLIEQAETLGEPLQDPLLLFTVLYGFWAGSYMAFNGDMARELSTQFLVLAEKQGAAPLVFGHSFEGFSLLCTGGAAESRAHHDQVIALYDPAEHRPLAARFGHDVRVAALCCRSWGLWSLGYPEAALAAADQAISDAREIGQAATLMFALSFATTTCVLCGNYAAANALVDELVALADEKTPYCGKRGER
jgi:hypothetical protein